MRVSKMIDREIALGIPIWNNETFALVRTAGPPEQEMHTSASHKQRYRKYMRGEMC